MREMGERVQVMGDDKGECCVRNARDASAETRDAEPRRLLPLHTRTRLHFLGRARLFNRRHFRFVQLRSLNGVICFF